VCTERENNTLKAEESTMKNNTYFQTMEQADNKSTFTDGQLKAYRAWIESTLHESSAFEVQDLPWDRDTHDFVATLRAAGITEFAVTDQSTALMRLIHLLAAEGCAMQGLCTVSRNEARWGTEETTEHPGILFRT